MRNLGALADLGVLDLDERAGLRALVKLGPRPDPRERPDRAAVEHLAGVEVRVDHGHFVAEHAVDQRRHRADRALRPDLDLSLEKAEGLDRRVLADPDVDVDERRGGVADRDSREHVLPQDAGDGASSWTSARSARVLMPMLISVVVGQERGHPAARLAEQGDHVAQVDLALSVVRPDLGEGVEQGLDGKCVGAGVDLLDRELLRAWRPPGAWSRRSARRRRWVPAPSARTGRDPPASRVVTVAAAPEDACRSASAVTKPASSSG